MPYLELRGCGAVIATYGAILQRYLFVRVILREVAVTDERRQSPVGWLWRVQR